MHVINVRQWAGSQLDNGDVLYMTATKNSLNDRQKIQNICCRVIFLEDMHKKLKLIPLADRRDIHLSKTCFKAIHDKPINSLNTFFNKVEGNRWPTRTRNKMNMKVPAIRSSIERFGFAYRGRHHWNELINDLKIQQNYNSLRTLLYKEYRLMWDNHPT